MWLLSSIGFILAMLAAIYSVEGRKSRAPIVAYADVMDANNPEKKLGRLRFSQITGTLRGLTDGQHGFHVHEKGELGDACKAAGGHFNPAKSSHGGPKDTERHVGDLGNINSKSDKARIGIRDHVMQLQGENSVAGRAIVVHADPDDLGKGGTENSNTTGNAGGRVACGIIKMER